MSARKKAEKRDRHEEREKERKKETFPIISVDSPDREEPRPIFHGELVSPESLLLPAGFLSEQA